MSLRRKAAVPAPPRVISPSPTPSDQQQQQHQADGQGPSRRTTRSVARQRSSPSQPLDDISDEDEQNVPGRRMSRTRSRSPISTENNISRMTPRTSTHTPTTQGPQTNLAVNEKPVASNGHLAPPQPSGWNWRDLSRSPSPLGLIPIHRHWRTFVHKHEVPRKVLHVSIGFLVIWLYVTGTRTTAVPPYLMSALIPIALVDWLRHRYATFNRIYVKFLGALMRESEYAGWNGVIFYLLGAWGVLYFLPKDVAVMSVLLLSWCDTAASTFGRLWGRYTSRIRRGKSLAGSLAAFAVGVATSVFFYGWLVPTLGELPGNETFMFNGSLTLPSAVTNALSVPKSVATITGSFALGVMSIVSGFIASASEAVDIFGWDDNLTIPVLSGFGIWGFLKIFG